jgi:hypothetical protein
LTKKRWTADINLKYSLGIRIGLKNFLPQNSKYGFRQRRTGELMFSSGSLAVFIGAAPRLRRGFGGQAPRFGFFAGGSSSATTVGTKRVRTILRILCTLEKGELGIVAFF